jgi:hypothetical protein
VAVAAVECEPLQLLLRHAGIVLELQGFKLAAIRGYATHPADKQSLSGTVGVAHVLLFLLPMRQRNERLEVGPVEIDSELHCFSLR